MRVNTFEPGNSSWDPAGLFDCNIRRVLDGWVNVHIDTGQMKWTKISWLSNGGQVTHYDMNSIIYIRYSFNGRYSERCVRNTKNSVEIGSYIPGGDEGQRAGFSVKITDTVSCGGPEWTCKGFCKETLEDHILMTQRVYAYQWYDKFGVNSTPDLFAELLAKFGLDQILGGTSVCGLTCPDCTGDANV